MSSAPQCIVPTRILQELGGDLNDDGIVKVSAFVSDEPIGLGQLGAFSAALAEEVPDAVVEGILFDPAEHSHNDLAFFAETVAQLSDDHNETTGEDDGEPNFLLGLTFPDYLAAIITAYAQADSDIKFVHGVALRDQKIIDSVGSDANGHEGCAPVVVDSGQSGEIFAKYIESVTDVPPNSMDAAPYDAAATLMLAALIAAEGESDPAAVTGKQIRNAMRDASDLSGEVVRAGVSALTKAVGLIQDGEPINYEGAQGPCDFDEHGSVRQQYVHFVIDDRQFVEHDLFDCVSDLTCPVL